VKISSFRELQLSIFFIIIFAHVVAHWSLRSCKNTKLTYTSWRLSDWIGNQECADELKEIVQDFFTPDKLPDPKTTVPCYH